MFRSVLSRSGMRQNNIRGTTKPHTQMSPDKVWHAKEHTRKHQEAPNIQEYRFSRQMFRSALPMSGLRTTPQEAPRSTHLQKYAFSRQIFRSALTMICLAAGGFLAGGHFDVKQVTVHDNARSCFATSNLNDSKTI